MRKTVIGGCLLLVFFLLARSSISTLMTPYRSLVEAQARSGRVQVIGHLVEGTVCYGDALGSLSFQLQDRHGTVAPVIYRGVIPANFDHASEVVVIGEFAESQLVAERLLVKCPSKYEEMNNDR